MKSFIKLPFIHVIENNLASESSFLQVILGPRQVGKTTSILYYLEHIYKEAHLYVSADKVMNSDHTWIRECWQKARAEGALLVVDEIQKIDQWAETIKSLWDEEKRRQQPIKCILLGSSSLDIQRGLSESLTGRFQLIQAHHWNAAESLAGYGISFEEFLKYGGYPGSYDLRSQQEEWISYIRTSILSTVIEKDILLNNTVKSPALFKQAFDIIMSYPAQEISYTKLLGQIQEKGNTDLVKHYLRLYEGAYLLRALEKYSGKALKTRTSSPKILPLCPSMYFLELQEDYGPTERGHVFELIVGAQLNRTSLPLYYWREGQDEVDYVLVKGKTIWAIEVKSGRRKSSKGLEAFRKKFPTARLAIITMDVYPSFEKNPMAYLDKIS
jgi:uncharacterized protein